MHTAYQYSVMTFFIRPHIFWKKRGGKARDGNRTLCHRVFLDVTNVILLREFFPVAYVQPIRIRSGKYTQFAPTQIRSNKEQFSQLDMERDPRLGTLD